MNSNWYVWLVLMLLCCALGCVAGYEVGNVVCARMEEVR